MITSTPPADPLERPAQTRTPFSLRTASRPGAGNRLPVTDPAPYDRPPNSASANAAQLGQPISIAETIDVHTLATQLDFVIADAVLPELRAASKEAVIRTLVHRLTEVGAVPAVAREEVCSAILRRESASPTAVGHGVAIPHAQHPTVPRVVAAVAVCPDGLSFGGPDGLAVRLIILLVSPEGDHTAHLDALRRLAQHLLAATGVARGR